jgi:hypothetical protein
MCKGKGKGKNNGSGNSSNNNKGSNTLTWPSYNPWTSTISMWLGMCSPQQPACPPQHALLATLAFYDTPGGPAFTPLATPPSHQ